VLLARTFRIVIRFITAATLAVAWTGAHSQPYPAKAVRFVLPVPPGGGTDILMRTILPKLSENLGQQIVIDNRPGGGSTIGSEIVARAPADGYTLLMIDTALTVNPSLYSKLPYDTVQDFAPVSLAATAPVIFVVHPTLPVRSLKELLALARAKPGQIVYASGGNGTSTHLAGELLKQVAKIDMVHVPYKGIGPAISDLLGGHVQAMFTGISSAKQHVYANKLRALAHTGETRAPAMPEVATFIELGWPTIDARSYWGALAPSATPREVVTKMSAALDRVLTMPDIKQRLEDLGYTVIAGPPERFTANIRSEMDKWGKVVKAAGIRAD